jgi:hypothetical protein
LRYDWGERAVVVLTNLSDSGTRVEIRLGDTDVDELIDLFGRGSLELAPGAIVHAELDPYGCRWLRLHRTGEILLL